MEGVAGCGEEEGPHVHSLQSEPPWLLRGGEGRGGVFRRRRLDPHVLKKAVTVCPQLLLQLLMCDRGVGEGPVVQLRNVGLGGIIKQRRGDREAGRAPWHEGSGQMLVGAAVEDQTEGSGLLLQGVYRRALRLGKAGATGVVNDVAVVFG